MPSKNIHCDVSDDSLSGFIKKKFNKVAHEINQELCARGTSLRVVVSITTVAERKIPDERRCGICGESLEGRNIHNVDGICLTPSGHGMAYYGGSLQGGN